MVNKRRVVSELLKSLLKKKKTSTEEKHMIKTAERDAVEEVWPRKSFHRRITCKDSKPFSIVFRCTQSMFTDMLSFVP